MNFWRLTFLMGLGLSACTADKTGEPVCFESEILPIFQSNCTEAGCHNSTDQTEGLDFTSFAGIDAFLKDEGKRKLLNTLKGKGESIMPPLPNTPLTSDMIASIENWLNSGAENSVGCDTISVCDTAAISFSGQVMPIFSLHCNGCHSGSAASGGYDFTTYDGVVNNTGVIMGSIRHELGFIPMPDGGTQLSACNIDKIASWINAGAPNN